MTRGVIGFFAAGLVSLVLTNRATAYVSASTLAGNAESPEGHDFQDGTTSATASASSLDPQFGTATADGTILGPTLSYSGFSASFAGPAWIANADLFWGDTLYLRFPIVAVTGSTDNLSVEFVNSFSWEIVDNGSYDISLAGLGARYSTAEGQQQDDFGELSGPSGSAELRVIQDLETLQVDPDDSTQYLATVGYYLQLGGHAGSGDWQHGSFETAFAMHSLSLSAVIIRDGETEIEPVITYGSSLDPQETADFDDDGDVDGQDFLLWQRGFGISSGAALGDGDSNADGDVDGDDLGIWRSQYGESGHLATVGSVPEPGPMSIAAMVIVAACARRKLRA